MSSIHIIAMDSIWRKQAFCQTIQEREEDLFTNEPFLLLPLLGMEIPSLYIMTTIHL